MSYNYQTSKKEIFTEQGQEMFLRIRDRVNHLLKEAGAVRMQEIMAKAGSGDSWHMLACVDRLVELGELRELTVQGDVAGQHRVFVSARQR